MRPLVALMLVLMSYGDAQEPVVLPEKKGYAIMPVRWPVVRCQDLNITYLVDGKEKTMVLPHRIRKELQVEYERVRKPSDKARPEDLSRVFGPLNLVKEKTHTSWVIPVHLRKGGHALVYVQKRDGSFEKGRFQLGSPKS